jgi:hypothetical protein
VGVRSFLFFPLLFRFCFGTFFRILTSGETAQNLIFRHDTSEVGDSGMNSNWHSSFCFVWVILWVVIL